MLQVIRAMLEEPTREMYGLEICKAAGLPSGTLHPVLARLEGWGLLESSWEKIKEEGNKPVMGGRPRRRYYRFSPGGAERARTALEKAHIPVPVPKPVPAAKPVTTPQLIPRTTGGA